MSNFKIVKKKGLMRAGVLKTAHGEVKTPVYMPVGTQGTVKALSPDDLRAAGAQIILGNTYHLNLRPTSKLIAEMGGLQKWSKWEGPILTDSGGFQAFSLGAMIEHGVRKVPRKVEEKRGGTGKESQVVMLRLRSAQGVKSQGKNKESGSMTLESNDLSLNSERGVEESANKYYKTDIVSTTYSNQIVDNREKGREKNVEKGRVKSLLSVIQSDGIMFKSHLDGSPHLLTPEGSVGIQLEIGSDIVLVLDELLSPLHSPAYVKESLERTHDWENRSQKFFKQNLASGTNPGAQLFGILQGVYDQGIREGEARWIAEQGFDGVSIGGSMGTSEYWGGLETDWTATKSIYETIGWVTPLLPEDLPRHALGIGEVVDFFECIERGADMFDCVSPTRRARNGSLYISPENGGKVGNKFVISLQRSEFIKDPLPIDPGCKCYTCQNFSRSYLRHLYVAGELLYFRLASIHNIHFMVGLVDKIRESIIDDQFELLKRKWLN
jgi:tRNA-guanine transglycosylase